VLIYNPNVILMFSSQEVIDLKKIEKKLNQISLLLDNKV